MTRWYGAPAVAVDVTELALLGGVLVYDQNSALSHEWHARAAGTAAFLVLSSVFNGAVVHGLNHHRARAAGSIALRAGALLGGLLAGGLYRNSTSSGYPCGDGGCHYPPPGIGFYAITISIPLIFIAIDDAFLAREPVSAAAPAKTSWMPTLRIQSGLALLGVGSAF